MSFKSNYNQQITLNDALFGLTDREKSMLEKSWAKPFVEIIFPKIDKSRLNKIAARWPAKAVAQFYFY